MSRPIILLVPGSLRAGSHTTRLLELAATLLPDSVVAERPELIRDLPHYDADLDGERAPETVRIARQRAADAAGLIISTPEYNGSIPGGLKDWLDWVTRPAREHVLVGKPVVVIGAAPNSKGAVKAVTWLHSTLAAIGVAVVGEPVAIPGIADLFDDDGRLPDEIEAELAAVVDALVAAIGGEPSAGG